MEELREWFRLWNGFPGALIKGWVAIILIIVVGQWVIR